MMWIVLGGFALVAYIDLLPLIRRRKRRAVAAFICIFAVALSLELLTVLKIEVPSTMHAMDKVVKWLGLGYPP